MTCITLLVIFFFFNDTATTEIYTLSLHDALPISDPERLEWLEEEKDFLMEELRARTLLHQEVFRSEEHTSELQSQSNLVCRLLLEKKKIQQPRQPAPTWSVPSLRVRHPHALS